MGISGGFDINDIANKLMGALDNIEEEGVKKGEKIGTKVGQAVREGLAEGLKDAEAEMMNTINQWARNSKRKQSISLVEFKTNENLIRELMKTDKYANTLRESFKDLTATIDGLGEVKGLDNILDALSKDEKALKKINFGPIKPAKKTNTKIEKDPDEAIKQLEKLEKDPWTIKEEEAVNNILKERLRILQKVGKEKIKAHDAEALKRIIEVNEEYENRLNGFRETRDDSIYEQLGDQYGYYNDRIQSALELQTLLSERLKRMKDIYFKDTDAYRNEQQVNRELQQRIENMQKIEDFQRRGFIEQKDVEDIVFELGTLDEKRSRLGGVQQDLFNLDDGDLDEAQLLLETYEKILVTTASGKKITLGPDMSEEDYKAFMKIDAEKAKSIEFIRKEKQLAIEGMEEQAEATKRATEEQKKFNDEKEKAAQNIEKPQLLQDVETLESREEIDDAKTLAQKRKAAEKMLRDQYSWYKEYKEAYESPDNKSNNGSIIDASYDDVLRQKNLLAAYVALYEKLGGNVEKIGKRFKELSDSEGWTGAYQETLSDYNSALEENEKIQKRLNEAKESEPEADKSKEAAKERREEAAAIREVVEAQQEVSNVGYHAGDLGKSEKYGQFAYGNRGTGHFGTGTYFVGNPEKIKGYNRRNGIDAPVEKVDFSKYNLFRPSDTDQAYKLHSALKMINDDLLYMHKYDNIDLNFLTQAFENGNSEHVLDFLNKYLNNDARNYYESQALEAKSYFENLDETKIRDEVEKNYNKVLKDFDLEDDEWLIDDDLIEEEVQRRLQDAKQFLENFDLNQEMAKRVVYDIEQGKFEDISNMQELKNTLVDRLSQIFTGKTKEELSSVLESTLNTISKYPESKYYELDSASTVFMKQLGYEGIDVRHTDLDNTAYGSVIYDLKADDLSRRQEILNARKQMEANKELTKSYDQVAEAASKTGDTSIPITENKDGQSVLKLTQDRLDTDDDTSRAAALKAGMQQIDLIKEETTVQEKLNQTRKDAPEPQQAEIVADNEKAAVSYEELRQEVERFNQVAAKGNNATDEEYAEGRKAESYLLDTVGLDNTLASMNEDGTLNLNALAQYLGIEIPQAADKAIDAIRQTEQAAKAMDSSQSNNANLLDFSIDRSNPMVANAFNGMNIKDWIKAYVQPDARGQLQDELYKLAQSVLPEYDSNVFDAQLEHIVDFIIKNSQRRETKEPNMYDDLFKQLVVTYTDEDVAAMGPQLFEEAKQVLGRRFQKRNDKNSYINGIDQLVSQIADSDFRSMFSDPDGNESQYNKLEELLKVFAKWKEGSKRKTKDVSLTERDAPDIENNILENIVPQMMANMGATAAKLEDEQLGFEGVAASSEKAAKGKRKFTEANKKAGPSASDSAEDFEDEADALDKINTSAEKIPGKYDSVTKYMIGDNTDPSTAVQKRVRLVNNIIQNETQRLSANDSGGWDVDVTSVNEQKLRGMRDFLSDYKKEAKKLDSINTDIRFTSKDGIDANFQASIDKYLLAMANLRNAFNNLQANPDDAGLAQVFDDAKKSVQDARTEVEGYLKQSQKLKQEYKGKEIANPIAIDASNVKNVQSAMMSFASSIEGTSFQFTKMSADGTKMFGTLDDGSGILRNITVGLDQASGQLHIWENAASNAGHATANLTNQWEDFRTQIIDGAKRIAGMYIGIQEFIQAFRTGFNYVKEIDLAMTELKKVTDETDASYKQFLEDAASTSSVIGSTISDFTEASANFARLGYSIEEAASMAETAIVYKNVADGLDTVEESTESIISTMKAFGIETNDTMSIIDKYNEVGNNFAITSAGIGEALQRSASALYEAGNTIDESIALVTAANSVIQNPDQVGTALKTKFCLYVQKCA